MHDIFDILGVPDGASGREIRLARSRRQGPSHPDFEGAAPRLASDRPGRTSDLGDDVAVDFANMTVIVGRMREAFFNTA